MPSPDWTAQQSFDSILRENPKLVGKVVATRRMNQVEIDRIQF
jgi:hypothetical protein